MTVTELKPKPLPRRDNEKVRKALRDLEGKFHDLGRAAKAAHLLTERAAKCDTIEDFELSIFAVEQMRRLAKNLRDNLLEAIDGEEVRS